MTLISKRPERIFTSVPPVLPATLLRVPTSTVLATAAGLTAVSAALAGWTQHRADRGHPASGLRA